MSWIYKRYSDSWGTNPFLQVEAAARYFVERATIADRQARLVWLQRIAEGCDGSEQLRDARAIVQSAASILESGICVELFNQTTACIQESMPQELDLHVQHVELEVRVNASLWRRLTNSSPNYAMLCSAVQRSAVAKEWIALQNAEQRSASQFGDKSQPQMTLLEQVLRFPSE